MEMQMLTSAQWEGEALPWRVIPTAHGDPWRVMPPGDGAPLTIEVDSRQSPALRAWVDTLREGNEGSCTTKWISLCAHTAVLEVESAAPPCRFHLLFDRADDVALLCDSLDAGVLVLKVYPVDAPAGTVLTILVAMEEEVERWTALT